MPFRPSCSLSSLIALAALAPLPLSAQQTPRVSLAKPDAVFAEPFDNVAAVRELRDGRVIVADPFAKTATLADLKGGTGTAIGREGQGPNEFAYPAALVPLSGDSTLLLDPVQRRFLVIGPDGRPAGSLAVPTELAGMPSVRGADRAGRIYFQGSAFGPRIEPGGPLPDSLPILRWDRARKAIDTLGRAKGPSLSVQTAGGANRRSVAMRNQPFSAQDAWSVTPDGRVGVARVGDYHVEWLGGARPVAGPAVRHERVAVSQADRDEIAQRSRDRRGAIRIGGPARGADPRVPEPEIDFPEHKPPFENRVIATPDGRLWVERSQAAGAAPLYDVFDGQGRLVQQVVLPKRSRVVGFGASAVYVARTDEDDLQWLERYRRP